MLSIFTADSQHIIDRGHFIEHQLFAIAAAFAWNYNHATPTTIKRLKIRCFSDFIPSKPTNFFFDRSLEMRL